MLWPLGHPPTALSSCPACAPSRGVLKPRAPLWRLVTSHPCPLIRFLQHHVSVTSFITNLHSTLNLAYKFASKILRNRHKLFCFSLGHHAKYKKMCFIVNSFYEYSTIWLISPAFFLMNIFETQLYLLAVGFKINPFFANMQPVHDIWLRLPFKKLRMYLAISLEFLFFLYI